MQKTRTQDVAGEIMGKGARRGSYTRWARVQEGCLAAVRLLATAGICLLTVDVVVHGIVGRGVASPVPLKVRAERLAVLERVLDEDDRALVESCYTGPDLEGVRSFCGHPLLLDGTSRLARVLLAAQRAVAEPGSRCVGAAYVLGEYEALGIDLDHMRSCYVRTALEEMLVLAGAWAVARLCDTRVRPRCALAHSQGAHVLNSSLHGA